MCLGGRALPGLALRLAAAGRELATLDRTEDWSAAHDAGLALLRESAFGKEGLPADWLQLDDPVVPWSERKAQFGYEAIRVPLFLAWDRQWRHPSLAAAARFMREPGFPATVSFDGKRAPYAAPPGFEAVARLMRWAVFGEPFELSALDEDYYSASLALLVALAVQDLSASLEGTA